MVTKEGDLRLISAYFLTLASYLKEGPAKKEEVLIKSLQIETDFTVVLFEIILRDHY
ncbi:MAG: hypothetical protein KJO26_06420 [Deltaproteobacteria bacterium]|nr:hypothetical protein [Deltaproteobacteria bacterium]NNK84232.1 hypothetical protein [Desulfobacterales bacterium]